MTTRHLPASLQLFEGQVPSVPSSSSLPGMAAQGGAVPSAAPPAGFGGGPAGGHVGTWEENTLDEPVWVTLKRDVLTIGRNLRSVLIPINWDFGGSSAALGNWDLWGPLVRGARRWRVPVLRVFYLAAWKGPGRQACGSRIAFSDCGGVPRPSNPCPCRP